MFKIGDNIFYPTQGVGIIDTIEKKTFCNELLDYYKIKFMNSTLTFMLPESRIENSNVRLISSEALIDDTLSNINNYNTGSLDCSKPAVTERFAINSEKYKSGNFVDYIQILTNLTLINNIKKLNASDKEMYTNTRKLVIDEITLVKKITSEEASNIIDQSLSMLV